MDLIICVGDSCHLQGSEVVLKAFQSIIEKEELGDKITLKGSFCMGRCSDEGVTMQLGDKFFKTPYKNAEEFFKSTIVPLVKT